MAMTPEAKIKKKLDTMLKQYADRGVWFFSPQSGIYGRSGIPDRIICARGRFVSVEVKAPGKLTNTTALQEQCGAAIMAAGGLWMVVDSQEGVDFVSLQIASIIATDALGVANA